MNRPTDDDRLHERQLDPPDRHRVSVWPDKSGHGNDAIQEDEASQPTYIPDDEVAADLDENDDDLDWANEVCDG